MYHILWFHKSQHSSLGGEVRRIAIFSKAFLPFIIQPSIYNEGPWESRRLRLTAASNKKTQYNVGAKTLPAIPGFYENFVEASACKLLQLLSTNPQSSPLLPRLSRPARRTVWSGNQTRSWTSEKSKTSCQLPPPPIISNTGTLSNSRTENVSLILQ